MSTPRRHRIGLLPRSPSEEILIAQHLCANCGQPLPKRRHAYCSDSCRDIYWQKHDWSWLRNKILRQQDYTCQKCGYRPKTDAHGYFEEMYLGLVVDHLVPIALGGVEFDETNLQVLCKPCNKNKTKKDMERIHNVQRGMKTIRYIKNVLQVNFAKVECAPKRILNDPRQALLTSFQSP